MTTPAGQTVLRRCGCGGRTATQDNTVGWTAQCFGCGLSTRHYASETEAAAAWNRALPGQSDAEARDASGWQPIETAPRDGTEVLLTDGEDVGGGFWDSEKLSFAKRSGPGWFWEMDRADLPSARKIIGITHWMPLPPPPAMSREQQEKGA
jgi:hypothetical protein